MTAIESEFHERMLDIYHAAAKLGYRPTYFLRMVQERGGVEAARHLLDGSTPHEGFARLWELGRLDLSVEALACEDRFRPLFSEAQCECARGRLADFGYKSSEEVRDRH